MKLQTYNYIKQCLEMGHSVKVVDNNGDTVTFISIGDIYSPSFAESFLSDEYEIIPRPPKLLKEGEKCVIIDTDETRKWAEDSKWTEEKKDLIGKICIISSIGYRYGYYTINEQFDFPYFMVAPVPPEENKLADVDTEDMVKELESRGLLVDGKVLK